jgi:hypothetical protein
MIASWTVLLGLAAIQAAPTITITQTPIDDKQACAILTKIASDVQAELPKMLDSYTRLDGVVVLCLLRTSAQNKFVSAPASELREGWLERKQKQWSKIHCENEAFRPMIDRGWRFVSNITLLSGERFVLDAKCNSNK